MNRLLRCVSAHDEVADNRYNFVAPVSQVGASSATGLGLTGPVRGSRFVLVWRGFRTWLVSCLLSSIILQVVSSPRRFDPPSSMR